MLVLAPLKLRSFCHCLTQAGTCGSLSPLRAAGEVERTPEFAARQEGEAGVEESRASEGKCRGKLSAHSTKVSLVRLLRSRTIKQPPNPDTMATRAFRQEPDIAVS